MLLKLPGGHSTVVDDEDAGLVGPYKWRLHRSNRPPGLFYATTHKWIDGKSRTIYLHRMIMNAPKGLHVDHINRDGLDNRRANLRLCTPSQNQAHVVAKIGESGFRGVSSQVKYRKRRWQAKVEFEGKVTRSKWTYDPIEAARMYDALARKHHGEFAVLNFPDEQS